MVIANVVSRRALRQTDSFEILRRVVVAIQLLLVVLLVIGRAVGGGADERTSYRGALTPAAVSASLGRVSPWA